MTTDIHRTAQQALFDSLKGGNIEFDYARQLGQRTEHRVLINVSVFLSDAGILLVKGLCPKAQAVRTFKVMQMENIKPLNADEVPQKTVTAAEPKAVAS